jgi:HEAT repeat protein
MSSEKTTSNENQTQESKKDPSDEKLAKLIRDLTAKDFRTKNEAIKTLGKMKTENARKKLFEIARSKNWNSNLRVSALDSLGRGERGKQIQELLQTLANDTTQRKELRRASLTQLSKYRDPKTIQTFIKAMDDEYRFIRFWAVRGLIKINHPKATTALINALGDSNEEIRKEARSHLEMIAIDIVPALIKSYNSNKENSFLRYGILGLLGRIIHPEAFKLMISALTDSDDRTVTIALRGIGRMKNTDAIPDLINFYRVATDKRRSIESAIYRIGCDEQRVTTLYLASLLIDNETEMTSLGLSLLQKLPNSYAHLSDIIGDPDIKAGVREKLKEAMKEI